MQKEQREGEKPGSAEHQFWRRQANKQRRRRNPSKPADNSSGGEESRCPFVFHVTRDPEVQSAGTCFTPEELFDKKKFIHLLDLIANLR